MTRRATRFFACFATIAVGTGLVVAHAVASELAFSSLTFRATWNPMTFQTGLFTIRCPVTLEGSIHIRTIAKNENALIGYVTRMAVAEASCGMEGRVIPLTTIYPWHMIYEKFEGALPNITSISYKLTRMAVRITDNSLLQCLYNAETLKPVFMELHREMGGVLSQASPSEVSGLALKEGPCTGTELRLTGNSQTYTIAGGATRITLQLVL